MSCNEEDKENSTVPICTLIQGKIGVLVAHHLGIKHSIVRSWYVALTVANSEGLSRESGLWHSQISAVIHSHKPRSPCGYR